MEQIDFSRMPGGKTSLLKKAATKSNDVEQVNFSRMPAVKTASAGGTTVSYYECGAGIPLVLLHGWPQTSYIWRKVIPRLQEQYHVFAVDLPGMGNSNSVATADTQTVARCLKEFCEVLQLGKIHLVAHDIGAWVATTFALEYEDSLHSLTVMDAGIPSLMPEEIFSPQNAQKIWQFYFHAIAGMPEFLIAGKEKEYLDWYFTTKTSVKDAISEEDMAVYVTAYSGKERLSNSFAFYRAYSESAAHNKSLSRLISIPILAIGAEQGQGLNMGIAMQKIAATEVHSVSISACGHYIAEEQPAKLLAVLLPFLERISSSSYKTAPLVRKCNT